MLLAAKALLLRAPKALRLLAAKALRLLAPIALAWCAKAWGLVAAKALRRAAVAERLRLGATKALVRLLAAEALRLLRLAAKASLLAGLLLLLLLLWLAQAEGGPQDLHAAHTSPLRLLRGGRSSAAQPAQRRAQDVSAAPQQATPPHRGQLWRMHTGAPGVGPPTQPERQQRGPGSPRAAHLRAWQGAVQRQGGCPGPQRGLRPQGVLRGCRWSGAPALLGRDPRHSGPAGR